MWTAEAGGNTEGGREETESAVEAHPYIPTLHLRLAGSTGSLEVEAEGTGPRVLVSVPGYGACRHDLALAGDAGGTVCSAQYHEEQGAAPASVLSAPQGTSRQPPPLTPNLVRLQQAWGPSPGIASKERSSQAAGTPRASSPEVLPGAPSTPTLSLPGKKCTYGIKCKFYHPESRTRHSWRWPTSSTCPDAGLAGRGR